LEELEVMIDEIIQSYLEWPTFLRILDFRFWILECVWKVA
jgi:hypothetical protein